MKLVASSWTVGASARLQRMIPAVTNVLHGEARTSLYVRSGFELLGKNGAMKNSACWIYARSFNIVDTRMFQRRIHPVMSSIEPTLTGRFGLKENRVIFAVSKEGRKTVGWGWNSCVEELSRQRVRPWRRRGSSRQRMKI